MYVIERRADGSKVSRMVNGREEVRAICVESGIRDWYCLSEVERTNATAGAGGPQRAAGSVLNVVLSEEEDGRQEEDLVILGSVQPAGQAGRGFWATNAGAGCMFGLLWAGAGVFGSFCRVFGPDVMVGGYIVGTLGWGIGYAYFLRGWYRSQPWQVVKSVVEVSVKDSNGREKVDRSGRVIVREEERAQAKRIGERLYVRAWKPFREQWVPAEVLGITTEEVT